jgi:hypothetical protein
MYLYLVLKLLARQAIGRASREGEPCTIDKRLQVAATSSSTWWFGLPSQNTQQVGSISRGAVTAFDWEVLYLCPICFSYLLFLVNTCRVNLCKCGLENVGFVLCRSLKRSRLKSLSLIFCQDVSSAMVTSYHNHWQQKKLQQLLLGTRRSLLVYYNLVMSFGNALLATTCIGRFAYLTLLIKKHCDHSWATCICLLIFLLEFLVSSNHNLATLTFCNDDWFKLLGAEILFQAITLICIVCFFNDLKSQPCKHVSWILEDFHSQSLELGFKYVCLWLRNRVWVHVWFK